MSNQSRIWSRALVPGAASTVFALGSVYAASAEAQQASDSQSTVQPAVEEVLVMARRRDERLMDVPVTVASVTAEQLVNRGVTTLEGFSRMVPQLFIASSSGSFQGGAIGLRGISAGDSNPFSDQAVAFNIDGVQIARSTPRMLAAFDMESIQVFKGPQALYYGKNSPGGIIALRTADPTDTFEAGFTGEYEIEAQEWRGEGFVSGPIADGFSGRVAVSTSTMQGWADNIATLSGPYGNNGTHAPGADEVNGRVTLLFDDGGPFRARLKAAYGNVEGDGIWANTQLIDCPRGRSALAPNDECRADDRVTEASLGTRFGEDVYLYGDGRPFSRTRQYLSGLELSYDLSDALSLAATTGYYDGELESLGNPSQSDPALGGAPETSVLASYGKVTTRELSQEIRLSSDFDAPVNFMVGAYYQDQKQTYLAAGAVNALNPIQLFPPLTIDQDGTAYSVFGSISYHPIDTVEISGGARYSHETKEIEFRRLLAGTLAGVPYSAGQLVPTTHPERSFHDTSPEATVTWRPTGELTTYVSWKRGFISGGFNPTGTGTAVALIPDRTYDQETVEGYEVGLRIEPFAGLHLNFAAYSYDIDGLQVTVALPGPPVTQYISNAASASSKGVETDFTWDVTDGLSLRGSVSYNRARYESFSTSPCYGGQTISLGCDLAFNGSAYTNQDLSGEGLVRAPEWAGSFGASYEAALSSGARWIASVDTTYSDAYFTDSLNTPGGIQPDYWMLDAALRYALPGGTELAVIGRNLTDEYTFQRSTAVPFTSGASGVAVSTLPDQSGSVSRGREIRLQVKVGFR
jgi:iron complex outermembrane receptor protein